MSSLIDRYNSRFRGGKTIFQTLHPIRWAAILGLGIPLFLALAWLIANTLWSSEFAKPLARALRIVVAIEFVALVLLASAGAAYEHLARRRDARVYRAPGKRIDLGGYRLHINCLGTGGPTVVLEYGLEASAFDWALVQPDIARYTRVCTYDRGGYGWSDPSPRPRIPSVMAEELHSLLRAAGEPPPYILAAHSFGSYNAIMFAQKYPAEVRGLVLVDGMPAFSDFPFGWRKKLSLRTMQILMPFGIPRWRRWCGGSGSAQFHAERQAMMCRPSLYATFYHENANLAQSAREIRGITGLGNLPVIVIARDPSKNYSADRANWELIQQEKLKLSTNSELIVATGSGHDIPLRRPDLIVAAVKKLAVQTPGTGGQPGKS
jgi:pimeloyl-ACP methyl ester carboxylesterase